MRARRRIDHPNDRRDYSTAGDDGSAMDVDGNVRWECVAPSGFAPRTFDDFDAPCDEGARIACGGTVTVRAQAWQFNEDRGSAISALEVVRAFGLLDRHYVFDRDPRSGEELFRETNVPGGAAASGAAAGAATGLRGTGFPGEDGASGEEGAKTGGVRDDAPRVAVTAEGQSFLARMRRSAPRWNPLTGTIPLWKRG